MNHVAEEIYKFVCEKRGEEPLAFHELEPEQRRYYREMANAAIKSGMEAEEVRAMFEALEGRV